MSSPPSRPNREPSSTQPTSTVTRSHDEVLKLLWMHKINTASGPDAVWCFEEQQALSSQPWQLSSTSRKTVRCTAWVEKVKYHPIHKSEDTSKASNYRLYISLLSLISKVLERCIHNKVMDLLLHNNLLLDWQFGFRSRSSTKDAIDSGVVI